ncbi:MAG: hemerythrin domain-containing protein [Parachlamydiales bacterium]|nr:hemerythrin domain-containing protein [Parachlamydiales bacterium]
MTIYDVLIHEHREVMELIRDLKKTPLTALKKREKLFTKIKNELTSHSRAEEKVLYSVMEEDKKGRPQALEGDEEHHVLDVLLKEMSKLPVDHERFIAKFEVMTENLEHHIKEEENEKFAAAKKLISKEEAEEMGLLFKEEKKKILAKLLVSASK